MVSFQVRSTALKRLRLIWWRRDVLKYHIQWTESIYLLKLYSGKLFLSSSLGSRYKKDLCYFKLWTFPISYFTENICSSDHIVSATPDFVLFSITSIQTVGSHFHITVWSASVISAVTAEIRNMNYFHDSEQLVYTKANFLQLLHLLVFFARHEICF